MIRTSVVPVAGLGTRLSPLTRAVPKELLPLGRKPVLQTVIEELGASGIEEVVLVTSARKQALFEAHFMAENDGVDESVKMPVIHYAIQHEQLGLGHAVLCGEELVQQRPFVVALGDAMIGLADHASLCQRMIRVFEENDADAVIAFQLVPRDKVSRYGIAELAGTYQTDSEYFELAGLVEKPSVADAPSEFAIAARYICKPVLFELLRSTEAGAGSEIQLTDALQRLIKSGGKVLGVPITNRERRYDVGSFDSYFTAFIEAAVNDSECGDRVRRELAKALASDSSRFTE